MGEHLATEVERGSDNVFEDLGFSTDEAANLAVRTDLVLDLRKYIESRGWTETEAATFFDETEAKLKGLLEGDVNLFSVDRLIIMLARAGMRVKIEVLPAAA